MNDELDYATRNYPDAAECVLFLIAYRGSGEAVMDAYPHGIPTRCLCGEAGCAGWVNIGPAELQEILQAAADG